MAESDLITVFLCGDVMTGRGLDQALPSPGDPVLYEDHLKDARAYVSLAEERNGPFARPLGFAAPWGEALGELERAAPDLRLVNLETSVTSRGEPWPDKGIHYRMHPGNLPCLAAARIDGCSLANNHVLDWGYAGLLDTLESLARAGLRGAGAGRDLAEAQAPAAFALGPGRRVLVFGLGSETSGIPVAWAAGIDRPGVYLLHDLTPETAELVGARLRAWRRSGDLVVASIHWGANWHFGVTEEQRAFAQRLIDTGGVDLVHGHSSHHVEGIEVYRGKLVLYGCGDLLDDYEGIAGHEAFRGDLGLLYFATVEAGSGALARLEMVPTTVRHFRIARPGEEGARWLQGTLDREGRPLGTRVSRTAEGRLLLGWD